MNYDTDKPTFEEMLEWKDRLASQWSDLWTDMEAEKKSYLQQFEVKSPSGMFAVKTGSAPADADAAIDSLVPPDISVKVKPARAREKYRRQADKLVRFGKAMLAFWRKNKDVIRQISSDMTTMRMGIARVMLDDSLWPERPDDLAKPIRNELESEEDFAARLEQWEDAVDTWEYRHRRKVPIVFQRRDPLTVAFYEADDGQLLVLVEHYQTTIMEVQQVYGGYDTLDNITRGREPDERVWVSDIWYGQWRAIAVDDQPLFEDEVVQHTYDEIPYIIMPFRELTFTEPNYRYRGMLTNAASLYEIEAQVLTMHIWMLAINAWRTYIGWTKDGRALELLPGKFVPVDERVGEYVKMLEGQPVPPELLQTSQVLDSYIQRNGVAQGPRQADGTRSGQQLWAIQAMRQLKIDPAKESLSRGLERALSLAAQIVEKKLRESLTLPDPGKTKDGEDFGSVTIKPDDIDGYYDGFEVKMGQRLDPALLEQWKQLQQLAGSHWMPHRTSIELSGATDNPQEWIDEGYREAVDNLPFILEIVGAERTKAWFGEDSWQFQMLKQKLAQEQQGGGGGQPGISGQPSAMGKNREMGGGQGLGQQMAQQSQPRGGGSRGGQPRGGQHAPQRAPQGG